MRLRVAVIGQSGEAPPELAALAWDVGRGIAAAGAVLLSGGRDGVMAAASAGASEAGGIVVGILPGDDPDEGNPHLDVAITTGLGMDARSIVLIHSSDAVIVIGGQNGTLLEISDAYLTRRPIVVLRGSGMWADRLESVALEGRYLDWRQNVAIEYADTPAAAVAAALAAARMRRTRPDRFFGDSGR